MGIQTATTGSLEAIQAVIISEMRYTAEFEAPCWNLCTKFTLGPGQKQITSPKVGTATVKALTDGVDMTDSQDFVITSVDLTTSEVGAKFILTDKMVRQITEDGWKMAGTLLGNAMAKKRDQDVIALFSGLDYTWGADNDALSVWGAFGEIANAAKYNFPAPMAYVHNPVAIATLARNAAGVGSVYYAGILQGYPEDKLRKFFGYSINGVPFISAGNIEVISGYDSAYGALFSKAALAVIESKAPYTERQRDASLRAEELIIVSDYGCFELDGTYGASCQHEIGALATTGTS